MNSADSVDAISVVKTVAAAPQVTGRVHARRQALLLRHTERGLHARYYRFFLRQRVVRYQVVGCKEQPFQLSSSAISY